MKLTATITTKQDDPIFNGHRDPRKVVRFFCVLSYNDEPIANSGIWAKNEQEALDNALSDLRNLEYELVRNGYERTEFEWQPDGWGQYRVKTPEDAARTKETLKGMDIPPR